MKKLIQAVAYLRCSDKKQDTSIEDQRKAVERYARGKYQIVRWYIDDGKSGSRQKVKREDFDLMLASVDRGEITHILAFHPSRFTRANSIEAADVKKRLMDAGTVLDFVHGGIRDMRNKMHRLISNFENESDNDYSISISLMSLKGKVERVKEGVWAAGGPPPYGLARRVTDPNGNIFTIARDDLGKFFQKRSGYKVELVPGDPEEVAIVLWLFQEFSKADVSYCELARKLNARGVPSPNGGQWQHATIKQMLRNPYYAGAIYIGKSLSGEFYRSNGEGPQEVTDKTSQQNRPIEEQVICWDAFEGLISKELFLKVNQKMKKRAAMGAKHKKDAGYPLTGVLFCGHCGKVLVAKKNSNVKPPLHISYRCSKRARYTDCDCGTWSVKQAEILPFILHQLPVLLGEAILELEAKPPKQSKNTAFLKKKLADVEAKIKRGEQRMLMDIPQGAFISLVEQVERLKTQRSELQAEIDQVENFDGGSFKDALEEQRAWLETVAHEWIAVPYSEQTAAVGRDLWDNPLPVETTVLRQKLQEMGLKVSLWWEENPDGNEQYNRWRLAKLRLEVEAPVVKRDLAISGSEYVGHTGNGKVLDVVFSGAELRRLLRLAA